MKNCSVESSPQDIKKTLDAIQDSFVDDWESGKYRLLANDFRYRDGVVTIEAQQNVRSDYSQEYTSEPDIRKIGCKWQDSDEFVSAAFRRLQKNGFNVNKIILNVGRI